MTTHFLQVLQILSERSKASSRFHICFHINIEMDLLHPNNEPSHKAASTQLEIDLLGFETVEHAPYSPGLA